MNNLTNTLLAGVALAALAVAPAVAQDAPSFHVTVLRGDRVVNKTRFHNPGASHLTYTFGVYSYISSSDLNKKIKLGGGHPAIGTNNFGCDNPTTKIKFDLKKTVYGKGGIYTETYSAGCGSPTVFYGLTYKLTDPNAQGHTDDLGLSASGKFEQNGTKYKATLNVDYTVVIE